MFIYAYGIMLYIMKDKVCPQCGSLLEGNRCPVCGWEMKGDEEDFLKELEELEAILMGEVVGEEGEETEEKPVTYERTEIQETTIATKTEEERMEAGEVKVEKKKMTAAAMRAREPAVKMEKPIAKKIEVKAPKAPTVKKKPKAKTVVRVRETPIKIKVRRGFFVRFTPPLLIILGASMYAVSYYMIVHGGLTGMYSGVAIGAFSIVLGINLWWDDLAAVFGAGKAEVGVKAVHPTMLKVKRQEKKALPAIHGKKITAPKRKAVKPVPKPKPKPKPTITAKPAPKPAMKKAEEKPKKKEEIEDILKELEELEKLL